MGLGASKHEIVKSQEVVKRLTAELQKATADLQNAKGRASEADKLHNEVDVLRTKLSAAKTNLEGATNELKYAKKEKVAQDLLQAKLRAAKDAEESQKSEVEKLKALLKAKEEQQTEIQQMQSANTKLLQAAGRALNEEEHPTYGRLLIDLAYKRVYCANARTLFSQCEVWEKQRAFREKRAQQIGAQKVKSGVSGWPGTITVVENESESGVRMMIIDGQHRLGAIASLELKDKLPAGANTVVVEVYPYRGEAETAELFVEINKAEPVLAVDLPIENVGATPIEQTVLGEAVRLLSEQFPAMFKPSMNCRAPHVNIDRLRDELNKAKVISEHQLDTPDKLLQWLLARNAELEAAGEESWLGKDTQARRNAADKAKANGFYLGMTWAWIKPAD